MDAVAAIWICLSVLTIGLVWAVSSLMWALKEEKASRINFEESNDALNSTIRIVRQMVEGHVAKLTMIEKADAELADRFARALNQIDEHGKAQKALAGMLGEYQRENSQSMDVLSNDLAELRNLTTQYHREHKKSITKLDIAVDDNTRIIAKVDSEKNKDRVDIDSRMAEIQAETAAAIASIKENYTSAHAHNQTAIRLTNAMGQLSTEVSTLAQAVEVIDKRTALAAGVPVKAKKTAKKTKAAK